ncbi:MAG: peptidylprolyl isomerase [Flavobacteriaceae bacterium]
MPTRILAIAAVLFCFAGVSAAQAEDMIKMELSTGTVMVKLRPDLAPKHVERIKTLAGQGFYNGRKFFRVIDGFMAQTGDPQDTGYGGSSLPDLKAEFSREPFRRGSLGMARSTDPNSANSQFFICYDGCGHLTGQYTLWGEVVSGMDAVDKIKKGEPPRRPDSIVGMSVVGGN